MPRPLAEYQEKRNPNRTPEPAAIIQQSGKRLRFVVQHHAARNDHYDFRLEWDGVLLSWAVPKGPSYNPKDKRLAVAVEAHPLEYRHFEGGIPKGEYGGGIVMLWDEGEWEPRVDVEKGLAEGSLKMVLKGKRLQGKWALVRLKSKGEDNQNWLLIKEKDAYVLEDSGITGYTTSVRTGRTMAEIAADSEADSRDINRIPFDSASVQLARLVERAPAGSDWLYELKYDGYRILTYIEGDQMRLLTRNHHDYSVQFASIAEALQLWSDGRAMVLDGEVVVLDDTGRTDFQALQGYLKSPGTQQLTYIIFDLLALDGLDLRIKPLRERKMLLKDILENGHPQLHYSNHVEGAGKEIFLAACQAQREGIVAKKADSVYSGTRNGDWLKIKCVNRQEFVIGGYTITQKTRGISALLLGVYEGEALVYAGRAGTGFSDRVMGDLLKQFAGTLSDVSPFAPAPPLRTGERAVWLQPRWVAEVQFAQWTEDHLLRQAVFKGLRLDKEPENVRRESIHGDINEPDHPLDASEQPLPVAELSPRSKRSSVLLQGIRVTNPDKEIFAGTGITKEAIAQYYAAASFRIMQYAGGRILSLVRCPNGYPGECFYQKHLPKATRGLEQITLSDDEKEPYFALTEPEGLISLVQMGTVELHTWGSRVADLEHPDMLVFDLDPEEGLDLAQLRQGVRDMKSILDTLSLTSYLKTSGGKGYHVVIPLIPAADWEAAKAFAKMTAMAMEEKWPEKYTSNMRKEKRKGKIFVDWIRNARTATSVAPYSVRARNGGPVSMPIAWEELDDIAPNAVDLHAAMDRLKAADPWAGFYDTEQKLL